MTFLAKQMSARPATGGDGEQVGSKATPSSLAASYCISTCSRRFVAAGRCGGPFPAYLREAYSGENVELSP